MSLNLEVPGVDLEALRAEIAQLKATVEAQNEIIRRHTLGIVASGKILTNVPAEVRFWWHVEKSGPNDCWLWRGDVNRGYGRFSGGGVKVRAHRYSLFLSTGVMPRDLCACHRCDNPTCVNPDHLYWGTYKENNRERALKGRSCKGDQHHMRQGRAFKGENHGMAKITDAQAREAKDLIGQGLVLNRIAEQAGITKYTLSKIKRGIQWKHV